MAFDLKNIQRGRLNRPPRMILCGVEKIGKSTFAAGAPEPVFLPVKGEEGIDALDVARFPTIESYEQLMEAITALYSQKHEFKTIVIDSISTLEPIIWAAVCKEYNVDDIEKAGHNGGGFGKGYVAAVYKWRELMEALDALRNDRDMGCILIGHVTVKTFTDPTTDNYDQYILDINSKAVSALQRWADCIAFANVKMIVRKEDAGFNKKDKKAIARDQRVLYTQKHPAHPGGGRGVFGELPAELPLEYPAFAEAVAAIKQ